MGGSQVLGDEPELFGGGFGLAAAADAQLVQDVAHVGLDGGQLHVHDLADLRVALVGAHQPQHLQFRRRQRLVWGEPGAGGTGGNRPPGRGPGSSGACATWAPP